jgi:hypothetical protein
MQFSSAQLYVNNEFVMFQAQQANANRKFDAKRGDRRRRRIESDEHALPSHKIQSRVGTN